MAVDVIHFFQASFGAPGLLHLVMVMAVTAAILTPLEHIAPAHKQRLVFRKELGADLAWWFFTPIITRIMTNMVLAALLLTFTLIARRPLDASLLNGFGVIAQQPLWLQTVELLFLADFVDYWTHRSFHTPRLWPFHAIHHSPQEMSWLSSSRVHPVNDLVTRTCQVVPMVLLGFSPQGIIIIVPYIAFYVMFLHSNIAWDFGPLRWFLVSPAYHRWHHTSEREGLDRNYAGIFPLWDILFDTAYFPKRLPSKYGVLGRPPPENFWGQIIFPFREIVREVTANRSVMRRTAPDSAVRHKKCRAHPS